MFKEPVDVDDINDRADDLFDIISNKLDFLEHRMEHD